MKIGMNMLLWTNHVTEQHYPTIEKLKETGYEGIEIPLGDGAINHYTQLGKHLADLELGRTAVTSLLAENNPASPDKAIREAALDRLKWAIDMAEAAGMELICGPFHSAFAHFTNRPPTTDERKWSVETLQKAGDYAQQAGVLLCPEALNRFECYLINTMTQLRSLLDEIDHPYVRAMYDTHHGNIEEKSHKSAFEHISPYLKHVHISENDRGTPGRGHTDWDEVFRTLKSMNFNGWLMVEAFSTITPEFANSINVWRNYSPVEEVYQEGYQLIKQKWAAV